MHHLLKFFFLFAVIPGDIALYAQAHPVNVFLGTSGDHGQLSPGASYPFSMVDICPQTYPNTHTGYEYKAKEILGFTHNRLEGVGCMGSGGNILIKPFTGYHPDSCLLIKKTENASPGYYAISFTNSIQTAITVQGKAAIEQYNFPAGPHGFLIDLSHTLVNGFIDEQHTRTANSISGWIQSGTTCRAGAYKLYYYLLFDQPVHWIDSTAHSFTLMLDKKQTASTIRVAFSAVSIDYAKASVNNSSLAKMRKETQQVWKSELSTIKVEGDRKEEALFYSLLYRCLQTPFDITEPDGTYRASDNSIQHTGSKIYNGWSIWDNYRTELPLLSLIVHDAYQDMMNSIVNLYLYGKKDWATKTEPSNTVRTEHAIVVLLDAYRKGYTVDFRMIRDSILKEAESLDYTHPDKALESSYDQWAVSQVLSVLKEDSLSALYLQKTLRYKEYWNNNFKDLSKADVDKLGSRNMYQGTIWQYRWFVPFDEQGLIELCGGQQEFLRQLDFFFDKDFYNAANEPDIQAPYLYQATNQPWKSQAMIHKYAVDTVIQYYYDENYRGIDPTIDRVYSNRPDAFIKSMDNDAGEMSSWYIMAACGLSPACVGWPVYYLSVPLFKRVEFKCPDGKRFLITVPNFSKDKKYIQSVILNGKPLDRNWLTQSEILKGGRLLINASNKPNRSFGIKSQWISRANLEK